MSYEAALRVLALDDEPFMLRLLKRALGQSRVAQVVTCGSAQRALQEMDHREGPPDLIPLDLNMAEMDAVEFLHKLPDRHYTGVVILVSGEDERVPESVDRLVRAHGIKLLGQVRKPFQPEALAARIEKWALTDGDRRGVERVPCGVNDLRTALANGELVNYYQPVVAVASGDFVGVECLVRWRPPAGGLVFPDQFIGVAEKHGLIDELTSGMFSAAFAQAREWRDAGLTLQMAVNVSTDSLSRVGFPDLVTSYATAAGVPPESVILEVTESRLTDNLAAALDVFNRLRLRRLRLAIDDFGTGHSSLAERRASPFDQLKIDRSFVHGAATDAKRRAIYGGALALGKELQLEVVAEGVEDRTDWDFLLRTGCTLAQGCFIGKPMPAEEIVGWLAKWTMRLSKESLLSPS